MSLYSVFSSIFEGGFYNKSVEQIKEEIIAINAVVKSYKKGETLLRTDEEADKIFLTVRGRCNIVKYSAEGKAVIVDELRPAQLLGIYEVLAGLTKYEASVIADEQLIAIEFSAEYIKKSMQENNALSILIAGYLAKLLAKTANRNQNTLLYSSMENLIIYIHSHVLNQKFPFVFTQEREEIAGALNINLRTLYRYLNKLSNEGYIKKENRKIIITKAHFVKMSEKVDLIKG